MKSTGQLYNATVVNWRDVELLSLHPAVRHKFAALVEVLEAYSFSYRGSGWRFVPFEGYRHPARQASLFLSPRRVSQVDAFDSAHQYGLAMDFVPCEVGTLGKWTWDVPVEHWDAMGEMARGCGLCQPISWDRPHIEDPAWPEVKRALRDILSRD